MIVQLFIERHLGVRLSVELIPSQKSSARPMLSGGVVRGSHPLGLLIIFNFV